MEETETKKVDLTRLAITTGMVLFTALVVGGTTWYLMDQNAKTEKTVNDKAFEAIRQQIEALSIIQVPKQEVKDTPKEVTYNLNDTDYLNILTINKAVSLKSGFAAFAPAIHAKDSNWATTSPIPLSYTQQSGYSVPGMGMAVYVWHKVEGKWSLVGQGGEGGYDDAVKALYPQIPTTIIPSSAR